MTHYLIYVKSLSLYTGPNRHWTPTRAHAERFEFMSTALHAALIDRELSSEDVEIVPVDITQAADPIARARTA